MFDTIFGLTLKKHFIGVSPRNPCVKSVRIRSYSGPHFPAFGLNTERYKVSLRIQSECGKIRTRITPNTDTVYPVFSFWETYTSFALTRSTPHQKMELDALNQKIRLNCDTLRSDRRLCEAHWNIPDIQKAKALITLFWKHKYYF